ncbi:methyltransferase [Mesotoga sp. HF07.pep.5.2.highcov]|uniref:B12-binding domain-containing radical SAM protein n=1 Tax=unclassified Mesotoga TaxID=1184398 RepID=UPI000C17E672|nr:MULTISPECIES: B12-binding domain-containing radical SAM protein [unclassified Mesotoga]MDK2943672.1 hypothetical protein [Mesotoga sp.]PIJ62479.1 methyltransferase [Mesotoga sp. H07.pep.5.3]RLL91777.1 methyltransferase [Mesotoga sp. HF07.pep.5.2.highcov]
MRVLMVYPEYPETFWSFKHALKFVSKKAAYPPLGLMTVAAMLPKEWEKKLIDMNTDTLRDEDIEKSDYVMISSMDIQFDSAKKVIQKCKDLGVKTIAGGPLFTTRPEEFSEVDHLVLGEAEKTLEPFLLDLEKGQAKHIYKSDDFPDIESSPIPDWSLLDMRKYSSMNIQYSRGCPYNCEFCDIVLLNGHIPRTKSAEKLVAEMEALYKAGWRGGVFIVDDNFIGNKVKLKREILPAIAEWMKKRNYPFVLNTETSIDLSDDDELMRLMVDASFGTVFVGIETTEEESLVECGKFQNRNRDLLSSVRKMQEFGLQVQGGFIVGFDHDKPSVFSNMIDFIQKSGIVTAMVGVLTAPTGTRLFQRLKKENRIVSEFSGNNTSTMTNIVPKMGMKNLVDGYYRILKSIYAPKPYTQRVITFLKNYKPNSVKHVRPFTDSIKAFLKSLWVLGIKDKGRMNYWSLLLWTIFFKPSLFPLSVEFAIYGYHFRKSLSFGLQAENEAQPPSS